MVTGGGLAVCVAMYADDVLNKIGNSNFVDPGLVTDYFLDHGAELGYRTERDYLLGARNLTKGGDGMEKFFRKSDGATLFYNMATNEFAILNKNGTIGTYFAPYRRVNYWWDQIGKKYK